MALNITAIERSTGKDAPYLLNDGGGLYLKVCPNGRKVWLYRYRDEGERERKVTLGEYPALDMAAARERKEATRARILRGEAPQEAALLAFEQVAVRWLSSRERQGLSRRYLDVVCQQVKRYLIPPLGARPLEQIQRAELVAVVEGVAKRGIVNTSHRVGVVLSQIYQYAEDAGILPGGGALAAASLSRVLPKTKAEHHATVSKPDDVRQVMECVRNYKSLAVSRCLEFIALTFVRSGEARRARWREVDFETRLWTIPAEHMKRRIAHKVPLSRQALALLEELKPLTCSGPESVIFASGLTGRASSSGILTDMSLLRPFREALKRNPERAAAGLKPFPRMTVHGLRSMASTILNEERQGGELIETQLSHLDADRIRLIYNNSELLDDRRALMQFWADWLDNCTRNAPERSAPKSAEKVINFADVLRNRPLTATK